MPRFKVRSLGIGLGYFHIRRSGDLVLASSLEAKFGARSSQDHQIREKPWEVLVLQEAKKLGIIPILGSYLKFKGQNLGYLPLYFWRQNLGLQHEFQR